MPDLFAKELKHDYKNTDCLKYLETLDSNSVDLVLVDPPYFEIVNNDWDNQWENEKYYLNWCANWTAQCCRVLKPNLHGIVTGKQDRQN